jgi:hypothetical protein
LLSKQNVPFRVKKERTTVEIYTKRYANIEEIPGSILKDCKVDDIMFKKDVFHPAIGEKFVIRELLLLAVKTELDPP